MGAFWVLFSLQPSLFPVLRKKSLYFRYRNCKTFIKKRESSSRTQEQTMTSQEGKGAQGHFPNSMLLGHILA